MGPWSLDLRVNETSVLGGEEVLLLLADVLPLLSSESEGASVGGDVVEGGKGLGLQCADGIVEMLGGHESVLSRVAVVAKTGGPCTTTARLRNCMLRVVWTTGEALVARGAAAPSVACGPRTSTVRPRSWITRWGAGMNGAAAARGRGSMGWRGFTVPDLLIECGRAGVGVAGNRASHCFPPSFFAGFHSILLYRIILLENA
jgi:hypothetical protein